MRTKYTIINTIVNIGGQFLTMLLAFVGRMVFIRYLSAAYLGVNGLFTDVLSILSFAELGIGTAMVFSMYEPAARDDEAKLARLMNLYKWMYRAVAASVLLFGLILLPFLPYLIKGGEGIENIRLIYMMYVLSSASSYLLNYKNSIYQAYQKSYIRAGWGMVCDCIRTVLQIIVLILTHFVSAAAVCDAVCAEYHCFPHGRSGISLLERMPRTAGKRRTKRYTEEHWCHEHAQAGHHYRS